MVCMGSARTAYVMITIGVVMRRMLPTMTSEFYLDWCHALVEAKAVLSLTYPCTFWERESFDIPVLVANCQETIQS